MKIVLSIEEKENLELQHNKEADRRVADRIKAVLLNAEGWTQKQISQALRIKHIVSYRFFKIFIQRGVTMSANTHFNQYIPHKFEAFPDKKQRFEEVFSQYHKMHGEPSDPVRVFYLMHYVEIANAAPEGDYLELGTHRGFAAKVIWEFMDRTKNFYCLDTFEGFKEPDLVEERKVYANNWQEGNFLPTSPESVKSYITAESAPNLHMIKGWFPDAFSGYENKAWRFVHIDFDLYAPIKSALEIVWDKIVPGGVCMIHDYGCYGFPGAKKAVDEFFGPRGIIPHFLCDRWGTAVVIKPTL